MGARHLGLSHAARRRGLPSGGLAGDPLPGRLQDRPRNRLAPQFQPARRPERRNSRGQRMGGPLRLSRDGMDARTVSCTGNSAAGELTLKHLERAQRRKNAPHNEERHPAPIDQRIHGNPPSPSPGARGLVIIHGSPSYMPSAPISSPRSPSSHKNSRLSGGERDSNRVHGPV